MRRLGRGVRILVVLREKSYKREEMDVGDVARNDNCVIYKGEEGVCRVKCKLVS